MFYELIQYKNLIVYLNIECDKCTSTEDRLKFISLYKQVYLAQRKKLKAILAKIKDRTIEIFPEPTSEEMISFGVTLGVMMIRFQAQKICIVMQQHALGEQFAK